MLSKKRIRLMTKLAIYDKNLGKNDKKRNEYFKWDYIYFKNLRTRMGVLLGCAIIAALYALKIVVVDEVDVFTLDLQAEASKIAFYTVVVLVIYTVIGTLVAGKEYNASKQRLDAYYTMLGKLDKYESAAAAHQENERRAAEKVWEKHAPAHMPLRQTKMAHNEILNEIPAADIRQALYNMPVRSERPQRSDSFNLAERHAPTVDERAVANGGYSPKKTHDLPQTKNNRESLERKRASDMLLEISKQQKSTKGGAGFGTTGRYKGTNNNDI